MEELRDVGFKKEKEEKKMEPEEPRIDAIDIRRESEVAIREAGTLLENFEALYEEPEMRARATGTAGVVDASALNYLLDAKEETNPEKKSELTEKGITTGLEILVGAAKTLIAGERRRQARRKKE